MKDRPDAILRVLRWLFVVLAAGRYPTPDGRLAFVSQLEHFIYDARLRLTMPESADPNIVILDLDEASLAEIGHWPWSRSVMAKLVAQLFDHYGVEVLGYFDVARSEYTTVINRYPDTPEAIEAEWCGERNGGC